VGWFVGGGVNREVQKNQKKTHNYFHCVSLENPPNPDSGGQNVPKLPISESGRIQMFPSRLDETLPIACLARVTRSVPGLLGPPASSFHCQRNELLQGY
jgi:hypothetical protein